jgi:hypothetical protein
MSEIRHPEDAAMRRFKPGLLLAEKAVTEEAVLAVAKFVVIPDLLNGSVSSAPRPPSPQNLIEAQPSPLSSRAATRQGELKEK